MSDVLPLQYSEENITTLCDKLGRIDPDLKAIIRRCGYPRIIPRNADFSALVRLILEQQVSLLSARAAYLKLKHNAGGITPEKILQMTDKELRDSYISRQKSSYLRNLAAAILDKSLVLKTLKHKADDFVSGELVRINGIGKWTADNYLLLCLRRTDIFPIGDIALRNSIRKIKKLPADCPHETMLKMAESWRPFRSIATQLFWHAYLIDKRVDFSALDY